MAFDESLDRRGVRGCDREILQRRNPFILIRLHSEPFPGSRLFCESDATVESIAVSTGEIVDRAHPEPYWHHPLATLIIVGD